MKYGFICMMDALGTKGSWRQETPEDFIAKLNKLQGYFKHALEADPTSGFGTLDVQIFSDTVFVTFQFPEDEKDGDPVCLLPWFGSFLAGPFTLAMFDGLFLRGAISQGFFYQSEAILVGPAVDDAASYYERADWLGIICTPSASYGIEYALAKGQALKPDIPHHFLSYEVPLKDYGPEVLSVLDWPKFMGDIQERAGEGGVGRAQLTGIFSKYPIPQFATSKYKNTLAFYDYSMKVRNK
jgi:hypothetical protein